MEGNKRSDYSYDDKVAILNFIIENKAYTSLRGNLLWQKLERQKVLTRTWQSLKEHFRKKIITGLNIIAIPDEEKRRIKEGWESTRVIKVANGKRIQRLRCKVQKDIANQQSTSQDNYDINDDSSSSDIPQPSSRKTTKKRKTVEEKKSRSPSEFNRFSDEESVELVQKSTEVNNVFSDEELINLPNYENKTGSVTNHNVEVTSISSSSNTQKSNNNILDNIDVIEIPTDSNMQKENKSIESDSADVTIIASSNVENNAVNNQHKSEFSLEEDLLLLNFIRSDDNYLRNMNDINVYRYYCEVHTHTKSPETLRNRFLNYIFPNINKYEILTQADICNIYRIAGVDVPDNLLENSDSSTDIEFCESMRDKFDCMYCHIVLNGNLHIFVSTSDEISHTNENVSDFLSKKFKIHPNNIHFTNFNCILILKQIDQFRKYICENYGETITDSLLNNFDNINIEDLILNLEICIKSFDPSEDEIVSESSTADLSLNKSDSSQEDIISTQEFNPNNKSTPQKQDNNEKSNINKEILVSDVLSNSGNEHNYNKQISQTNTNSTIEHNYNKEISQTDIKNTENSSQACSSSSLNVISYKKFTRKKNNSQYLNSSSSQESVSIRDSIQKLVTSVDVHNFTNVTSSSETFHTANYFSQ